MLLATGNPAKAAKLRWLLDGLPYEARDLRTMPGYALPDETGASFVENAQLKAVAAARACDGLALASDGGVLIPALGAVWDELRTGRAAGPGATDAEKAHHLLALAKHLRGDDRRVVWSEAVVLADPDGTLFTWESAATEGRLTEAYDPANAIPGFWVYSLWWFPDAGKRYVDLTPDELAARDATWGALRRHVHQDLTTP